MMDQTTGAAREENAKYLEAAIQRLHHAGLLVVVDLGEEIEVCLGRHQTADRRRFPSP